VLRRITEGCVRRKYASLRICKLC